MLESLDGLAASTFDCIVFGRIFLDVPMSSKEMRDSLKLSLFLLHASRYDQVDMDAKEKHQEPSLAPRQSQSLRSIAAPCVEWARNENFLVDNIGHRHVISRLANSLC